MINSQCKPLYAIIGGWRHHHGPPIDTGHEPLPIIVSLLNELNIYISTRFGPSYIKNGVYMQSKKIIPRDSKKQDWGVSQRMVDLGQKRAFRKNFFYWFRRLTSQSLKYVIG